MIARDKVAATQSQIAEQLDGLSLDADIQALQKARDGIHKRIAQADVDRELRTNSIDNRLDKIKQRSGNTKAKKRLAEMKAARAAKNKQKAAEAMAAAPALRPFAAPISAAVRPFASRAERIGAARGSADKNA